MLYSFRQIDARKRLDFQEDIRMAFQNNEATKAARTRLAEMAYADDPENLAQALFSINQ